MVTIVLFVGLLNFAVGFGLYVYLDYRALQPCAVTVAAAPVVDEQVKQEPEGPKVQEELPPLPVTEEIPEEWLDMLEDVEHGGTFVEASVQVLRLEVGRYRDSMIAIDRRVRQCREEPEEEKLAEILKDIKATNEDWLARQAEAAGHLSDRKGELEDFSSMGNRLEEILMDQAAQIETTCNNIDTMDFSSDMPGGCKRLNGEICKLVDMAHVLRDRMQESLVAIMASDERLDSVDSKMRLDSLTGLQNRTGIETAFAQWHRDDPERIRQISIGMIDVDRFGRINEQYGAIAGDRLLAALGPLIEESFRDNRGNDVVARLEGERFIVYMGDTGPRNATSALERLRRTIEESTFELDEEEIELTVRCGVVEVIGKEDVPSVLKRLAVAVREARRNGRNCTYLDEGEGPDPVTPPDFDVKGKVVRVQ